MKRSGENNLIIFHGGIGDVLLWTPALKAFEQKPDVLYLNNTPVIAALKQNGLVNNSFKIENKAQLFLFALKHLKTYHHAYLNHLSGGEFLLKMMKLCSRKIVSNSLHYKNEKDILMQDILPHAHDALQNYYLVHDRQPQLSCSNFELQVSCPPFENLPSKFVVLQLSAGDSKTPYKNWPVKHWAAFLEMFTTHFPERKIVLLGHPSEADLVKQLTPHENIISLIGKTSIEQAFCVIAKSDFFIGLDGGLMHVAVAMGRPTFTIWGGSSPQLYGYEKFAGPPHKIVQNKLSCGPCNAWLHPNVSKTTDPMLCGDYDCLFSLSPQMAFDHFCAFAALT